MDYLPLLLLSFLIHYTAGQGCGCRGSSSCGQGGCASSGGCSGGGRSYDEPRGPSCNGNCASSTLPDLINLGNNYSGGSYQRDEGRGFRGSLERLPSKKRRGRQGKRSERRGRKNDDEDYDEDDDRYNSEYEDENERRRKPAKIGDPKKRRFRMKRAKRETEERERSALCNSLLIRRGLETGMSSLLNTNQTTPLALSPASSLHALMKTRSKKNPSPWGIICGPADALDQLDLSIDTKMYCYHQVGETSCFAFRIF